MRLRWSVRAVVSAVIVSCAIACAASGASPTQFSGRPNSGQIAAGITFLEHQKHLVPGIPPNQSQSDWLRGIVVRESFNNNGSWTDTVLLTDGTQTAIESYNDGGLLLYLRISVGDYIAYYNPSNTNLRDRDVKLLTPHVISIGQGSLRPQPSPQQINAAIAFMASQPKPVVKIQSGQNQQQWQRAIIIRQLDNGNQGWFGRVVLPNGSQETIFSTGEDGPAVLTRVGLGDYIIFYTPPAQTGGFRNRDLKVLRQQAVPFGT